MVLRYGTREDATMTEEELAEEARRCAEALRAGRTYVLQTEDECERRLVTDRAVDLLSGRTS